MNFCFIFFSFSEKLTRSATFWNRVDIRLESVLEKAESSSLEEESPDDETPEDDRESSGIGLEDNLSLLRRFASIS